MVDSSVTDYIRQLLDKGYSLATIRAQLADAGYSERDIDSAINYVYSHPYAVKKAKAIPKKLIIGAAVAVVAVILVLAIFVWLPGTSNRWLSLSTSAQADSVYQGEDFSFTNEIVNLGKPKQYSIFLSHEVTNSNTGSLLTIKTETVPLETSTTQLSKIKIPADSKPGEYLLTTTAVFLDQKVTKAISFQVNKKAEAPSCSDRIQNQGEGGIDCGGPCQSCEAGGVSGAGGGAGAGTAGGSLAGAKPQQAALPQGAASQDHDADSIPNIDDSDDDNDNIIDTEDDYPYDFDNDNLPDIDDADSDNDGILDDADDYPYDFNNDGISTRYGPPVRSGAAPSATAPAQCLESCNDYDICTRDSCVSGICQHVALSPCCGDFICEGSETAASCPQDCAAQAAPKTKTASEIIQEAVQQAAANPEAGALKCYSLSLEGDADECFFQVADIANETSICEQIKDDRKRDSCFMNKLLENSDLAVCDKIINQIVQRTCYSLVNIRAQENAFTEKTGFAPTYPDVEGLPGLNLTGTA